MAHPPSPFPPPFLATKVLENTERKEISTTMLLYRIGRRFRISTFSISLLLLLLFRRRRAIQTADSAWRKRGRGKNPWRCAYNGARENYSVGEEIAGREITVAVRPSKLAPFCPKGPLPPLPLSRSLTGLSESIGVEKESEGNC